MNVSNKRSIRWGFILLLTAVLVPAALLLALYMPPIQQAAKTHVTRWLTKQTGMEIQVENIRLYFPLRIELRGIRIGTLLALEQFDTDIRPRPLTRGKIEADYISARGVSLHTSHALQVAVLAERFRANDISYKWREREANIRDISLVEGSVAVHDSGVGASTPNLHNRLPVSLSVSEVRLRHITTAYTRAEMQLRADADDIVAHGIAADTTMALSLKSVKLQDGALNLQTSGMTPWVLTGLTLHADSLRYSSPDIAGRLTHLTFTEQHGLRLREGTAAFAWREGILTLPHFMLQTDHSNLNGHLRTWAPHHAETRFDGDIDALIGHADIWLLNKRGGSMAQQFGRLYPTETLSISVTMEGTSDYLQVKRCDISLPTAFDIRLNGSAYDITDPKRRKAHCHWDAHTYDLSFLTALTRDTTALYTNIPYGITCQGDFRYAPDTLHTQCLLALDHESITLEGGYRPSSQAYTLQVHTDSLDLHRLAPHGEFGMVSLQSHLAGRGFDYKQPGASIHGTLQLHALQWREHTLTDASVILSVADRHLQAQASCRDSLMQWALTTSATYSSKALQAHAHIQVNDINLQALQISDTDIRPTFQCDATFSIDSARTYSLQGRLSDIVLSTPTQSLRPRQIDLQGHLAPDTALIDIRSGDLTLTAKAHAKHFPWQRASPATPTGTIPADSLPDLHITLSAGHDNPASNYLSLKGINIRALHGVITGQKGSMRGYITSDSISAKGITTARMSIAAHYAGGTLHATLHTEELAWHTPQIQLRGSVNGTMVWGGTFAPDSLSGLLRLSSIQCAIPAYSLYLHTADTLDIPLRHGTITLTALPLYTTGKQPLLLSGSLSLLTPTPSAQLRLSARNVDLIRATPTRASLLHGKALMSGDIALSGPFSSLAISGDLHLRTGSTIHYIYKDAILTANNQLANVVTFTDFSANATPVARPKSRLATSGLSVDLNVDIAPTVQLDVSLGAGKQNHVTIQGGGALNLQYTPVGGVRIAGRYTIQFGELNINIPLLHASHMTIRPGSTVSWAGNPRNPQFYLTAEERIRASVTLDDTPQSVLFAAGLSVTNTLEKLNLQFTLSAPESASMQNALAALSPEERGKLSVALLTTGLYLGEGGTGNLMNTALMSILQSQLDGISRDAFRTIDVSVGIDPLPNGVSGISTRTDYSFSVAKRLWDDRIRIVIGGSVTTDNERIEEDAVIDNISIEWRITPSGSQYLRLFYDKNFESILEGEIREAGIGYVYRRQLYRLRR